MSEVPVPKLKPRYLPQCPPDLQEAQVSLSLEKEEDACCSKASSSLYTAPTLQFSFRYAQNAQNKSANPPSRHSIRKWFATHLFSQTIPAPVFISKSLGSPSHLLSGRKSLYLPIPHRFLVNYPHTEDCFKFPSS